MVAKEKRKILNSSTHYYLQSFDQTESKPFRKKTVSKHVWKNARQRNKTIVVNMYQLFKRDVHGKVGEAIEVQIMGDALLSFWYCAFHNIFIFY